MRVFAAGKASNLTIEVYWRSGLRSTLTNVKPNRIYEVDEGAATTFVRPAESGTAPLFNDVSELIKHSHRETAFDDFGVQPLLVNRLSQPGPGVTWADIDRDGWDDLVIGSGKGGAIGAFRNDGKGGFTALKGAPFEQPVTRDQTTILPWQNTKGDLVLLAGSANYEDGLAQGSSARAYNVSAKVIEDVLPGQESSTGPLAMADIDGDGYLDLFIGGRLIPGKWPKSASSLIFRGSQQGWVADAANTKVLAEIGLVSGATFSDLTGDGLPELVLACEWGPIRVLQNKGGIFTMLRRV